MANRLIMKNSTVAGKRPATGSGSPGEIFVNVADRVIGSFDASGNPIELGPVGSAPAVAPFDATHSYVVNDLVANAGKIYRAKVAGVNAWNAANWEDININPAQPVTAYDQTATYSANDLVAINGKIYSSIAGSVAGVFDATKWTELGATYTLPIATATVIGGVKANAGTSGQYVTGIDATGALTYATPPDVSGIMPYDINKTYALNDLVSYSGKVYAANKAATGAWDATKWNEIGATYTLPAPTATTLGGVKANVGTAGQFVSGVAADGSLTYASVTGGLTYLGNQDLTAAYVAPTPLPNVGSFLTNTGTGRLAPSWAAVMNNPPSTVAAGDTAVWDGTHYNHNIGAMTALAAATATTLGGVKANAGTDGQFVNGIASDGALTYGNVSVVPFDATKSYKIDDLVSESGKIYRAKVAVSPAAFVANQWTEIGAAQTFTAGSIPFADTGGALTEDNAALFWDKANKRLGVGTKTPDGPLHIRSGGLDRLKVLDTGEFIVSGTDNGVTETHLRMSKAGDIFLNNNDAAYTNGDFSAGSGMTITRNGIATIRMYNRASTAAGEFRAGATGFEFDARGLDNIQFKTSGSERMRITADGRLGIGVVPTATDPLLTVGGGMKLTGKTTAAIKALTGMSKGSIEFSTDANALCFYDGTAWQKCTTTAL